MKIAIHYLPEKNFSQHWVNYCKRNNISYKIVDCYKSDILQQLADCDGLMWHWNQEDHKAVLFARQLILSLEKKKFPVFPNSATCWHFDDKLGQKYLMESTGCALIPSHAFYSKKEAEAFLDQTDFPKVFKLRGGAASINVRLIKSRTHAQYFVNRAFGRGFKQIDPWERFKAKLKLAWEKRTKKSYTEVAKAAYRVLFPSELAKMSGVEKGYLYMQDFIPNNEFDVRVYVLGHRCYGLRRFNRKNDFRASGGGKEDGNMSQIDQCYFDAARDAATKLGMQVAAFDVIKHNGKGLIVEVSYSFPHEVGFDNAYHGYFDENWQYHDGKFNPLELIAADFVAEIDNKKKSYANV
jgi:glutathione synthase/RimK-type ligase-like ATP-grasp enzyme